MIKRGNFKRAVSFFLSALMLVSCFSFAGVVSHGAEVEAMIGSTEYQTLEQAIADAKNGDVIILCADATIEASIDVTKTVIIRTNDGNTVTAADTLTDSMFKVNTSLTLIGVTLDATQGCGEAAVVNVSGGTFTMRDNATISGGGNGGVAVNGGVFNFNGGTINSAGRNGGGSAVYMADSRGRLCLSGQVSFGDGSDIYLPEDAYLEITGSVSGSGYITITTDSAEEGRRIADIGSGASVSGTQLSRFRVSCDGKDYSCVKSGDEIVIDKSDDTGDEARIGNTTYETLEQAFEKAKAGDTVTLLSDATLESSIEIDKNLTLDSDGNYTVYSEVSAGSAFVIAKSGALTVSDNNNTVTISAGGAETGSALADVRGKLTIGSSVTISGNVNMTETVNKGAVYVNGGSFVMNGGSVSSNKSNKGTVYINGGSFVMKGGNINSNTATVAGGVYIASGSFELAGGSIYANSGEGVWNAGTLRLSGNGSIYSSASYSGAIYLDGETRVKVAQDWAPSQAPSGYSNIIPLAVSAVELYRVMAEFDGEVSNAHFRLSDRHEDSYALMPRDKTLIIAAADEVNCVYWENNAYMTIEEAIAALPQNTSATLRIVGDVLVSQTVTVPEGMTVSVTTDINPGNMADYTQRTVKRAEGFTAPIFIVSKGAFLTIEAAEGKSLVFDGEQKNVSSAMIVVQGNFTLGNGATLQGNYNKAAENLSANPTFTYGGAINIEKAGNCLITGGSIKDNYAGYGAGIYVNDGAVSISGGEITENKALYGGGIFLESTENVTEGYSVLTMTGGIVYGNTAEAAEAVAGSGFGGGVYLDNNSLFNMTGGDIESNKAVGGAAVCVGTATDDDTVLEPQFTISDKASISSNNAVYLAKTGFSRILVTSNLSEQKGAVTISIPEPLPQNMELVRFRYGDNENTSIAAAESARAKKLFVLDDVAGKLYGINVSPVDKTILINTAGEIVPVRAKSGEHHNGLERYSSDTKDKDEENKTEIVYDPVVIRENGAFTSYYEINYYPNLYENVSRSLAAPFPMGTRIVMLDYSDEENVGYYYYIVGGEETVVAEAELANGVKAPDTIEIPLINFYKMGTTDTFYEQIVYEEGEKAFLATEKLLFVVDFIDTELNSTVTLEGEHLMSLVYSYPGEKEGVRYDISSNLTSYAYTVSNTSGSTVSLSVEDDVFNVSYKLDSDSLALAKNSGVMLFQLGHGNFPRGCVITDEKENQYASAGKATVISVPLPVDEKGELIPEADIKLTFSNYYGTALVNASIRVVIAPSDDGLHYTVGASYDAQSEGVRFELAARDEYAILVTTPDGEKKPYYENYDQLAKISALEMTVKGLANREEVESFNLSLLKKEGDEYIECSLSELFNVDKDYGNEVILSTGNLSLELTPAIEALKGNEYKVAFKVGDAIEYIKVNVTDKK